jgi:phosphoglucosamine mutase
MTERQYFGTDGIRGRANTPPMTVDIAQRVGMAAGRHFVRGDHRHRVLIGKDTRLSGYMLEAALTSGFSSVGMDVFLVGPMPTPAVAMLTKSLRADIGVMISASHNPYHDNGIKLFGPDGFKLSDEIELAIEAAMQGDLDGALADAADIGRVRRLDDEQGRYVEYAKATFPTAKTLDGLKVVIDCAHGAAYKVAPKVLWELGAEIVPLGVSPNGFNINDGCGSTDTAQMRQAVLDNKADLGIALDGDADRVLMADEKGRLIDGDQLMGLVACEWQRRDILKGGGLVTTVMSNLGLERHILAQGMDFIRTKVGDRYVVEHMRAHGYNLGGEQSGHIVMTDYGTTGDGLVSALQVLNALVNADAPASEVCRVFEQTPQILENVRYSGATPLDNAQVKAAIADGESQVDGKGRLVIRPSGTEPLIRVMGECDDEGLLRTVIDDIVSAVRAAGA